MSTVAPASLHSVVPTPILEELLIRADRAAIMASLSRGIAHDLRGPLQTLTLLVDPHADLIGGADGARLRGAVSDSVQHLANTIGSFSQIYAPAETEPAPVIVDDLLSYVAELQRYQRGLPVVEVELRLQGGLPPVRGIEAQLRHLLLSLLTNAKQALHERDDGEIVLAAAVLDGDIRISIEDNGTGLPSADLEAMFEPFRSTIPDHFGIGLTVARCLAQRHGGSLRLEPSTRGGTRAVLALPSWRRGS